MLSIRNSCVLLAAVSGVAGAESLAPRFLPMATLPVSEGPIPANPPAVADISVTARTQRTSANGSPAAFELWSSQSSLFTPGQFFSAHKASFSMRPSDEMQEISTEGDDNGLTHTRMQQVNSGIPVEGAGYTVSSVNGKVVSGQGEIATNISISPTPTVSEGAAAATALTAAAASQYRWDVQSDYARPLGELVVYSRDFGVTQPFVLAWRFVLSAMVPRDTFVVYVDAKTGQLIWKRSLRLHSNVPATGLNTKLQLLSFMSDQFRATAPGYRLREDGNRSISTFQSNFGTPQQDVLDADNIWIDSLQRAPVSAHWAAEQFWSWQKQRFSRTGLDGHGSPMVSLIAPIGDCAGEGSFFDPASMHAQFCASPGHPTGLPEVDLESVGHEFGHGVQIAVLSNPNRQRAFGFADVPESAALGEAFADIFATSLNTWTTGNSDDWTLFEESSAFDDQRDLASPKLHGQPDTYKGVNWLEAQGDPHLIAGVVTHWFYLLAHGGSGTNDLGFNYSVASAGRILASKIAYQALIQNLTPRADFAAARTATMAVAANIDSNTAQAVADAWDAVGVTDPTRPSVANHLPADGTIGVTPWPVRLSFDVPLRPPHVFSSDEGQWRVEVSSDPGFITDVLVYPVTWMGSPTRTWADAELKPITVYYWRVKALHTFSNTWDVDWAFTGSFETSRLQPRNVHPTDGANDVAPWPVTFSWDAVPGAVSYEVSASTNPSFSSVGLIDAPITNTTSPWFVTPKTSYFWRVRARGPALTGFGDWSSRFHSAGAPSTPAQLEREWDWNDALGFITRDPVPVLSSPADGAKVEPWGLALKWVANGATSYDIAVSANSSRPLWFTTVAAPSSGSSVELVQNLSIDTQYWWWVRARRGTQLSSWSAPRTFTTNSALVTFTKPANGAAVYAWPVELSWNAKAHASEYAADISAPGDSTFLDPGIRSGGSAPPETFIYVEPKPSAHYYWRVRARGPTGEWGGWSNQAGASNQTFVMDDKTRPVGLTPNGISVDKSNGVTFSWSTVLNADWYRLRIVRQSDNVQVADTTTTTHSQTVTTGLDYSTGYTWFVRSIAFPDIPGYEASGTFTTKAKPPPSQACNSTLTSGGIQGGDFWVNVGKAGTFNISWNFFDVSDEAVFSDSNGAFLASTGCQNYTGVGSIHSTTSLVHVVVHPRCQPGLDTKWEVKLDCVP